MNYKRLLLCFLTGATLIASPAFALNTLQPLDGNKKVSQQLFEMLILEGAQAGLSWETVLKKRQGYRDAFYQFDVHKVANMTDDELEKHEPEFTILCINDFVADPKIDGTRTDVFILIDLTRKIVLIGGTEYAGEMKKSMFGVMNFLLPGRGIFPMHCSANIGDQDDTALFFGLSGTGKTTLSADPNRKLIGDDEHGWSDNGTFNFEGGCYAKCINLSQEAEPEIWNAIKPGALLENVVLFKKIGNQNKIVTKAKTGELISSEESNVLQLVLFDGNYYQDIKSRDPKKRKKAPHAKSSFEKYTMNIDLSEFNKVDLGVKGKGVTYRMLKINELLPTIDSLEQKITQENNKEIDNLYHSLAISRPTNKQYKEETLIEPSKSQNKTSIANNELQANSLTPKKNNDSLLRKKKNSKDIIKVFKGDYFKLFTQEEKLKKNIEEMQQEVVAELKENE